MTTNEKPALPENSTFASRRAAREADEARNGIRPRHAFSIPAGPSSSPEITHVQP